MKKIKTFLPLFSGFYNTIFEPDETTEIEYINEIRSDKGLEPLDYDDIDFDYDDYRHATCMWACKFVEEELKSLGLVEKIIFENLYSPKYYNYSNDSINCEIWVNVRKLSKYVNENVELFTQYLKENYTSYDGFLSAYSNEFSDWKAETKNFMVFEDEHKLGAILGCVLLNEQITEYDMYEYCTSDKGVYFGAKDFELETTKIK